MTTATLAVCTALAALAAPVPKTKPPVLELAPFATTIRADDPIKVLITFRNNTGADIVTKGSALNQIGKAFRIEAKHEKDAGFTQVPLTFYMKSHDDTPRKDTTYPAGCEFALWWIVTGEPEMGPFPKVGEWTVRAVIETADGPITSPNAYLTVKAAGGRPEGDKDGSGDHFVRSAFSGSFGPQHLEFVRELEKMYPDTYRATVLRRAILVTEYKAATTAAERNRAAEAVKEHCKDLPAFVRDKVYLNLAEAMANAKEFADAAALLTKVETPYDLSRIRNRIEKRK